MRKLLVLTILWAAPFSYAKVKHYYMAEICDIKNICAVLTVQNKALGLIGTESFQKYSGLDAYWLIVLPDENYEALAGSVDLYVDIEDFYDAKRQPRKKERREETDWGQVLRDIQGVLTGTAPGTGVSGSKKDGKDNGCNDCHTDGKHGFHPPLKMQGLQSVI